MTYVISIHALLAESDLIRYRIKARYTNFYPRSPCGERPHWPTTLLLKSLFLSTLSLRRATRTGLTCGGGRNISIHALLAESDILFGGVLLCIVYFYPRSPCGERQILHVHLAKEYLFLSTLSLRRATASNQTALQEQRDFYPRSPCGERLKNPEAVSKYMIFLSTLSLRRATAKVHKTVGHFCAYETNFMEIASSC